MPKIDVARLNALRPKPKPSETPPETVRIPSDDGEDSMEVDRVPMGRTLRKRKEKVEKHLKRGANDKEKKSFRKRVFRIPLDKPFEEAYYTHRLWMFFRETREKEEDIRRMFCQARKKMRKRVTLKKKSDHGQFAIPCTMKDHLGLQVEPSQELFTFVDCSQRNSGGIVRDLEVQIGNALVPVDFHVLDIKLNWNSSLLLGRDFLSTVGAVCNLQTNQLCLTLIDPNAHYDPIPVKKPQTTSRRINHQGIIATCHCGVEYETDYSASVETHTATSIENAHKELTDTSKEESVDSSPDDWENDYYNPTIAAYSRQNTHTEEYDEDYEEERATEYKAILDEEEKLLHHSSWKRNAPSIDITRSPSIDTQPHQRNRKRASTDNAYYSSIDAEVDHAREGDFSIGSWADEHHHESYAVETTIYTPGADELHDSFTDEELLNMQRRDETDQNRAATAWERTHFSHTIDKERCPTIDTNRSQSIDIYNTTSIDIRPIRKNHYSYTRAIDGRTLHVSREDIADILQTANGADNLFRHQRNIPEHQQKVTKEFYDTTGGIDKSFKQRSHHPTRPSIDVDVPTSVYRQPEFGRRAFDVYGTRKFYWEEKDEYGVYKDDLGYARDLEGRTIYTKDEINEMFYGVCGEQKKNKEAFQVKLDGVYYPLNDSISWLTTCMEEMKQDIDRIQHATDIARPTSIDKGHHPSIDNRLHTSIDNRIPTSVDNIPPHSPLMKSPQDFHTREEIDQLVEGIYRALETTEERLDGRCDDIYFPMDLSINALTSKIEAMQGELVEIQSYIAPRLEASASIDRRKNKLTDIHQRTLVDDATNRGRLLPKVTSDTSNTYYHGEEISANTYVTFRRHQFNLESLGDRLQRMENTTATIKEKWCRGDEAIRDFTALTITPTEFTPGTGSLSLGEVY
ncbi:hypothetical protein F2Q68_00011542 [Brassica cretica]|uniref:Uncharacterized protein n=1 Tax=Brassica cretica TaxID=69181 RepID=A0A8S9KQG7_BRACR|nr:hypothetical protein F2Q68_00011542 [Brassica cretica]